MPEQRTELDADTAALLASVHDRAPLDPAVLVADGHGVKLTVRRGQLRVECGTGPARTERTLTRIQRQVRRIVVLGDTGYPSIDAARWCADTGVTVVMADREGRAIGTLGAPAPDDARLTRTQAFAGEGGPLQAAGLEFVKSILAVKLAGQADIAENVLRQPGIAAVIREHAAALDNASSALEAMGFEGAAAAEYWNAWNGSVEIPFTGKEAEKVPLEWTVFQLRESVVSGKPRHATDPVNAMLNYAYRLAEAECRIACLTYGLDPGMGFLHVDKMGRDSLALDLMEAVRPHVDRFVLRLLGYAAPGEETDGQTFTADQFTETRDGVCRLVAPLTHEIAEQARAWAAVVGEYAATLRRTLAALASGDVPPVPKTDRTTVRPLAAVSNRPAGQTATGRRTSRHAAPTLPATATAADVIPDELWEAIRPLLPTPRQPNRTDQRADLRAVVAGAVCTEVLGVPGRHLPPALGADRKTVRTRLRRWQADTTWTAVRNVLDDSPHLRQLRTTMPRAAA